MSKINEVAELVEKGKAKLVGPAVQEAIDEGDDPVAILNDGMISAMSIVGDKFKNGEIFVPEMLVAARAMKKGVEVLKPHLASGSTGALGKVIIATVSGDLHDIGKNLVAMMIESAGFEVIDLGVDVPAAKIIECYKENPDVKIIALSALLTTTMPALKETVEALSSIIIGEQVNPKTLGALLAHFENKIMFQGFLWNVNSFDQEGVQLGKVLAKRVLAHDTDGALKVYSDLLNI